MAPNKDTSDAGGAKKKYEYETMPILKQIVVTYMLKASTYVTEMTCTFSVRESTLCRNNKMKERACA